MTITTLRPAWKWAKKAICTDNYNSTSMSILQDNSAVIITGYYNGTITFENLTPLTSLEGSDIFVAKIDSSGNWIWATKASGIDHNGQLIISVLSDGSAIVTGIFTESVINFGDISITKNNNNTNIFVAKINSSGVWQWASYLDNESSYLYNMSTLSDGSAIIAGKFTGSIDFGDLSSVIETSNYDMFVAKINSIGEWEWAKNIDTFCNNTSQPITVLTDDSSNIKSIAVLSDDSSIITGFFSSTITFGNLTTLTSSGQFDTFVAKIDSNGNWIWSTKAGGVNEDCGISISTSSDGSSVVVGTFSGTINFENLPPLVNTYLYLNDIFVAKLDSSGNWVWAIKTGGSLDIQPQSIKTLSDNSLILVGNFFNTVTFGNLPSLTPSGNSGNSDIFITKIDSSGNWKWAKKVGGDNTDYVKDITISSDDYAYITGSFDDTIAFGNTTLTSSGGFDIFVAKIYVDGYKNAVVETYFSEKLSDNSIINVGTFTDGSMIFDTDPDTVLINDSSNNQLFISKMDSSGNWNWAIHNTGNGSIYIDTMSKFIVNSDNSIVIAGFFIEDSIIFDTTVLPLGTKTNSYYSTLFITNIDSSGNLQWAISSSGTADYIINHIIKVSNGYIISGKFADGTLILGSTTLSTTDKNVSSYYNIFIAKLDLSGNWIWASQSTGTGNDYVESIDILSDEKIIVNGSYNNGTMIFATSPSDTTLLANDNAYNNIFVTLLDLNGNFQWAKQTTGTGNPFINKNIISILSDDTCIFSGNYSNGTLVFGLTIPVTLTSTALQIGDNNIFMAKINSDGDWIWARQSGGTGDAIVNIHSELSDDYAVIAGKISGGTSFFNTDSTRTTVTSSQSDIYITKTYTNDNTTGTQLRQICSSVLSEGGYEKNSILKSIGTNSASTIIITDLSGNPITAGSTLYACSIRIRTDTNGNLYNTIAIPNELIIYLNTKPSTSLENPVIEYRLVLAESSSITPTTGWITYSANSGIQYKTYPYISGISALEVVKSGILEGKTVVDLSDMGDFILQLGRKITGKNSNLLTYNSYAFVLMLYCINIPTGIDGSTTFGNISFKLGWNEI